MAEDHLMEWAQSIRIRVFDLPGTVEELHHRAFRAARYRTAAWIVAYVRHNHSNYCNLLTYINGHGPEDGRSAAQELVQKRVNEKIVDTLNRHYGDAWRRYRKQRSMA